MLQYARIFFFSLLYFMIFFFFSQWNIPLNRAVSKVLQHLLLTRGHIKTSRQLWTDFQSSSYGYVKSFLKDRNVVNFSSVLGTLNVRRKRIENQFRVFHWTFDTPWTTMLLSFFKLFLIFLIFLIFFLIFLIFLIFFLSK